MNYDNNMILLLYADAAMVVDMCLDIDLPYIKNKNTSNLYYTM